MMTRIYSSWRNQEQIAKSVYLFFFFFFFESCWRSKKLDGAKSMTEGKTRGSQPLYGIRTIWKLQSKLCFHSWYKYKTIPKLVSQNTNTNKHQLGTWAEGQKQEKMITIKDQNDAIDYYENWENHLLRLLRENSIDWFLKSLESIIF